MKYDEFQKIQASRQTQEAVIDQLESEWNSRFPHAEFSRASMRKFFRMGLPMDKAFEAIDAVEWKAEQNPGLASDSDGLWRYLCGTCWNMINGVALVS